MKNNRLSTRVLAVFAAVLLMMTLSIPTFAATEYVFEFDYEHNAYFMAGHLPEGKYRLLPSDFTHEFDGVLNAIHFEIDDVIDVKYCTESDDFSFQQYVTVCAIGDPFVDLSSASALFVVGILGDSTLAGFVFDDSSISLNVPSLRLVPVDSSPTPSLSDYITADTIPNVLTEVVSLLPLALGALVSFIAIRKGISYLQSFLHSS